MVWCPWHLREFWLTHVLGRVLLRLLGRLGQDCTRLCLIFNRVCYSYTGRAGSSTTVFFQLFHCIVFLVVVKWLSVKVSGCVRWGCQSRAWEEAAVSALVNRRLWVRVLEQGAPRESIHLIMTTYSVQLMVIWSFLRKVRYTGQEHAQHFRTISTMFSVCGWKLEFKQPPCKNCLQL